MDYRKANRLFLYMILFTIAFTGLYAVWMIRTMASMPILLNNVISELLCLVPALAMVLFYGERISVIVPLKKIRIPSALMIFLYVLLLYPLVIFFNSLSMIFVENTVVEMMDEITALPWWQMFLSIGIVGPFIEEFVFRGVILSSFQRSGRIIGSIIISSLMFGMMHLNINQFAYGAAMGVMFALLVEATGSVLSSFIAHAIFNSVEVIMLYAEKDVLGQAQDYMDSIDIQNVMLVTTAIYFVLAIISTAIAICVLVKIAYMEKRHEFFLGIPKSKKQGYKLVTVALVVAVVIALIYMVGMEIIMKIAG
ncbi:CPBP family intramembrane metalloprotease [Butyrivibrio sp. CB08]|uniref:CPBP family intramembrane glutamic endopeptidase n=1 Tax=Butyrivibrio sp. CB08 TaxID=2364879 RepID=UPI000EA841F9|nr:CPBP family intramembrane glutamic endopeptidase [Butyrivibrio sp. CB08]RKM59893.1 CPBP family intramembrane metalloprotease [Butyrivibrio sp. CB08]